VTDVIRLPTRCCRPAGPTGPVGTHRRPGIVGPGGKSEPSAGYRGRRTRSVRLYPVGSHRVILGSPALAHSPVRTRRVIQSTITRTVAKPPLDQLRRCDQGLIIRHLAPRTVAFAVRKLGQRSGVRGRKCGLSGDGAGASPFPFARAALRLKRRQATVAIVPAVVFLPAANGEACLIGGGLKSTRSRGQR